MRGFNRAKREKSLTARRNPVPASGRVRERQAADLFADFTGHDARYKQRIKLPNPKTGFVVGELDGVLYTAIRDGRKEKYVHKFRKKSRPLLVSSHDGSSLHILGGGYEFTERGIEDA